MPAVAKPVGWNKAPDASDLTTTESNKKKTTKLKLKAALKKPSDDQLAIAITALLKK